MVTHRQDLDTLARSCAWRYAANGCTEVPDGCSQEGLLQEANFDGQGAQWIEQQRRELESAIGSGNSDADGDKVMGAVWGIVSKALAEAFTNAATARPKGVLKQPALLGGGEKVVESHFQLACNLKTITAKGIVMEAWDGVM
jgi:hypothetical protein